jgi:hypothetical protein
MTTLPLYKSSISERLHGSLVWIDDFRAASLVQWANMCMYTLGHMMAHWALASARRGNLLRTTVHRVDRLLAAEIMSLVCRPPLADDNEIATSRIRGYWPLREVCLD